MQTSYNTNLEGEEFEGVGEAREGLVTGAGLCNQRQGAGWACDLSVGDLHTGRLRDIVLEARSGSRGHAATTAGAGSRERTGRISAEGRPRQHYRMCVLSNEEERRRRKPEGLTAIGEVENGESTRRLAVC